MVWRDGRDLRGGVSPRRQPACAVRLRRRRRTLGSRATSNRNRDRPRRRADGIFVGNAFTWQPPTRFDFVRTELEYVPEERQRAFLDRLLAEFVTTGGRLILCGYGSPRSNVATHPVRKLVRSFGLEPELELEVEAPEGGGPIVEIAVLRAA